MNERMLELYRQAQVPYTAIDPSNNMPYETTTFSAEKFAELIVKECADIADEMSEIRCEYPGDAMVERFGFGTEEGAATWRTK